MAPKVNSRDLFCTALKDEDSNQFLSERVPFRFRNLDDNKTHKVEEGDTLFLISGKAYEGTLEEPSQFFWAIADFQPDPILDPTLELEIGRALVIPSARTITELILSEDRRDEFEP